MKRQHCLILLLLLSGLIGIERYISTKVLRKQIYQSVFPNLFTQKSVSGFYADWRDNEEKAVWIELEKAGLPQERFNEAKQQRNKPYFNRISPSTAKLVQSVFNDFNVDKPIEIRSFYKGTSPAAATDDTIFINEHLLKELPIKAQKFVIAHELQHILEQDYVIGSIVGKKLGFKSHLKDKQHPCNKFYRFQEMRADLKTIIKSSEYAEGQIEFMEVTLKELGNGDGITHPHVDKRLAMGQKILALHDTNYRTIA